MQNFRDIAAMAEREGVGFRVNTTEELAAAIVERVRDTKGRTSVAERATALIRANRGAAARYAEAIAALADRPRR
jgi:3-deoxy-D-manno-octulosonic-acid transferase